MFTSSQYDSFAAFRTRLVVETTRQIRSGVQNHRRPHPPTVRFASIADLLLRCREPPVGATSRLIHRRKRHKQNDRLAAMPPKSDEVFGSGCNCSGAHPLPSPPAEQATASQGNAGQASAGDWTGPLRLMSPASTRSRSRSCRGPRVEQLAKAPAFVQRPSASRPWPIRPPVESEKDIAADASPSEQTGLVSHTWSGNQNAGNARTLP